MNDPSTPQLLSRLACLLLAAWWLAAPAPARAETSTTCTGFIDSVPAVIGTQGIWCLRRDVSTAQATGNAIEIMGLVMSIFLFLSLTISGAMNFWNARTAMTVR